MTRRPFDVTVADVDRLRTAGLSDADVHRVASIAAYFNFVNRIALGLGVELEPDVEHPAR